MASYAKPELSGKRISRLGLKPFVALGIIFAVTLSIFGALFGLIGPQKAVEEAEAFDPVGSFICTFFPEEGIVRNAYQASQTDALYFDSQSKSAVSSGKEDVNSGLNWILMASGMDFNKVNEGIIGQEVEKAGTSLRPEAAMSEEELKEQWNKGPQVSPFDRFGMAGTTFSSYNGEWKYFLVDACSDEDPVDLKEGAFYDNRLETKSTWEDRSDSKDPRTMQHYKGETSRFWFGFVTLISNMIFWVTKFITTVTIAFINFSFSDMSKTLGINGILSGDSINDGLFGHLFTGIYTPLIILALVATGLKIFWDGAVKRQFRKAMGTMGISLGMFFVALAVSVQPSFFVNLPNNAAVIVQAVIVKSFTGELAGASGLCSTDMGSKPIGLQDGTEGKADQDFLEGVAANMRSSIGCTFWQTFVFKPWAEGQWGTSWNETWAKDKTAAWAPAGAKELQNTNAEIAGEPVVPLGDGKTMSNWAVFNLSTLTNAHSPIGHEGSFSKYSQGVAHDWWRIVDTLTNYEEMANKAQVNSADSGAEDIEYTVPKGNPPLEQWDNWSGNNPGTRFASAISSLFIGGVGLIAPLFLGLMAAVYSLAMTIVMVFLPVMLLFGAWGGRGFNIFKQWAKLLWSLFTKRIAVGIMLMLSIVFVNASIVLMDSVGWWQGALMLVVLTFIIIKSRHKISDMLAASSAGSFAGVASRISEGISTTGKTVGGIAVSAASGAAYSKIRGGTMGGGAMAGMKQEFNNLSYRTPFLRDVRAAQQSVRASKGDTLHDEAGNIVKNCALCQEPLEDGSIVKMGSNGLWYCQFCAESEVPIDGGVEMLYVSADRDKSKLSSDNVTPINGVSDQRSGGKIKRLLDEDLPKARTAAGRRTFAENIGRTATSDMANTIDRVRNGHLSSESLLGSNIPVELQPYLDPGMLKILVDGEDWEAVSSAFIAAYVLALEAATAEKFGDLLNELLGNAQSDYRTTANLRYRSDQLQLPQSERELKLMDPRSALADTPRSTD